MPRLLDFSLFADENIAREVIAGLRALKLDVSSVVETSLIGTTDRTVLRHAFDHHRVVLTHDPDFGALAVRDNEPFAGIVFIRPGDMKADEVLSVLQIAHEQVPLLETPFILVLELRGDAVRFRVRSGSAG